MHLPESKGIKLRGLNKVLAVALTFLYLALIMETIDISSKYHALIQTTEEYISCQQNAALLSETSDYLTEQVRLYVVNTDEQYMTAYFTEINETHRREQALEGMRIYHDEEDEIYQSLEQALADSDALTETEIYAMKLVATACGHEQPAELQAVSLTNSDLALDHAERIQKAQQLVFDLDYQQAKTSIQSHVDQVTEPTLAETRANQLSNSEELSAAIVNMRFFLVILLIINLLVFCVTAYLVVRPLHDAVIQIQNKQLLRQQGAYELQYLAVTYNDIYTRNIANEEALRKEAKHDGLTGLLNRGAYERITAYLSKSQLPLALLLIDVDKFKEVNDQHSHHIGDEVLRKIAKVLTGSFRANDYVARIGGDEFAVIMGNVSGHASETIAHKVEEINHLLQLSDGELPPVSLSVGVSFAPCGYSQELFNQADAALYQTKGSGRCGCSFYNKPLVLSDSKCAD